MNHLYKVKAKYKPAFTIMLMIVCLTLCSSHIVLGKNNFHNPLTYQDSLPRVKKDNVNKAPANLTEKIEEIKQRNAANETKLANEKKKDSLPVTKQADTFDIKFSKDTLDAPVAYHADDSMVLDVPGKKILLYGTQTKVKYTDNELIAPHIEFDQKTNLVKAWLVRDSGGKVVSFATFNQGDFKSVSDSIWFNMGTGKGRTKSTYFQQDEMYVQTATSKKIKENGDDVIYARFGKFTTCNLDTPHFCFVAGRIKFINKKMAVTGPVHPEIEGVPLPVTLPFGIYPLKQGRHSGILAPTFSANAQLGLSLEGLGYYKVLSDNWDVVFRSTIYSYGGWVANISPNYYKRYRYRGNLSFDIQRFKYGFKGDPDFSLQKTYNIRWNHSADSKARPGVTFSANVNAGSSKFNSLVPNSPVRNFTNQLNSSITYSKVWKDKPFNLTVSANHNQNTAQGIINLNLPDVAFNVNTLYPFRKKEQVGEMKWYENLGIALNSNIKSLTSFYDTLGNIGQQLIDKLQWGANHSVPITLSLPQIGALQFAPQVSYAERWYQQKFIRKWNSTNKKIDTIINKGFYTARDMTFGMGVSTRIFGMFTFGKKSRVQAIRHEIRPTLSVNYKPDFNKQFYYRTQIDTNGNTDRFSVFEGSVAGAFAEGQFGGLSFGIDNNIQMKVKNKRDTGETAIKKINLLDGFSINGSYNFMADSFRLSTFSISARSNLFDKINITANANVDPYQTDATGKRLDKLIWGKRPFSLGTLTSGGISMQSQLRGGDKKAGNNNNANTNNRIPQYDPRTGMPMDEYQQEAALIQNNPAQYVDFSIPWSVNLSYSLQFSRQRKADYSGFTTTFNQDVNWGGTLGLTKKWQIGMNGFYNITRKEVGTISLNLSREMHCWQMAINVSPVGKYKFFNITINPKSGLLRDLKVNRTRYFYDL